MEFDPTQAMKQLKTIQRELNRIYQKVGHSIKQRNKEMRDHIKYQKHISKQHKRTQHVLEKAKRAASQGTRKKGRTVESVQGRETPPKVLYKMSDKLSGDLISSKTELEKAQIDLKDAEKKITALRKVGRTEQHSRNINTLQEKVAKVSKKISKLAKKLNSPLADVQKQNQSYDSSPTRIIEDVDMVSPGQLEGNQLKREFQRIFPYVSESDLEEELAAILKQENTPSTSVVKIEHKSSSPPQQKAKSNKTSKTKTPLRSPPLSPESQRILDELESEYQEDQKALQRAKEQANISAAFDPYTLFLTEEELREVNEEAKSLGILDGGKSKKRKTRKRKRRRKTRKRKKKRRKRKTRRR